LHPVRPRVVGDRRGPHSEQCNEKGTAQTDQIQNRVRPALAKVTTIKSHGAFQQNQRSKVNGRKRANPLASFSKELKPREARDASHQNHFM
jgi:hypothetical protein